MSKKWKIAAVCAGVPVLLIVALIIVVHTYDYNRLKPRIESAVQNATGRELTMAGDISLDFGFSPALVWWSGWPCRTPSGAQSRKCSPVSGSS